MEDVLQKMPVPDSGQGQAGRQETRVARLPLPAVPAVAFDIKEIEKGAEMTISYDQAVAYLVEERGRAVETAKASDDPFIEAASQGARLAIFAEGVAYALEVPVETFKDDVLRTAEAHRRSAADAQQRAGGDRP